MENEKGKLKRFQVTQSVRFSSNTTKILYYIAIAVEVAAILRIGMCIISHSQKFLGAAVVFALLGVIWLFSIRLISFFLPLAPPQLNSASINAITGLNPRF